MKNPDKIIKDLRFAIKEINLERNKSEDLQNDPPNNNKAETIIAKRLENEINNIIPEIIYNIKSKVDYDNKLRQDERKRIYKRLKERGRI